MKKILLTLVIAAGALIAVPGQAQAASAWHSSGLSGVQASGSYSRTGNTVHFYGRLYDTAGDSRSAKLEVDFTGECCSHLIVDSNGSGTSVAIDLKSTNAPHIRVQEITQNSFGESEGPWVTIY